MSYVSLWKKMTNEECLYLVLLVLKVWTYATNTESLNENKENK